MKIPDQIRLTDLLLQRDEAFVRVADCERQIQTILGVPYPYPPLPELPSLCRKKPVKKAAAGRTGVSRSSLKVRPLKRPAENAYRVEYRRDHDTAAVSFLTDPDLLRRLLSIATPQFRVTAITTVSLRAPDQYTVVDELYRETGSS